MKIDKLFVRIIGVYQILGGLLGLFGILRFGIGLLLQNFLAYFITGLVFSYGVYCGLLLLRKDYAQGVKLSLTNQFFQLSQIKILGFGFEYVSGIYLALGFTDEPTFSFQYYLADYKSTFFITYSSSDNEISVLINLIAVAIFVYLFKVHDKYLDNQNQ